ncbi:hypothetical protein VP01_1086g3 [Puccinia sorghi]|uniref:BTB domain-containing protein n=1 Tax=Puccinia sorghi TaxID=27349 RepID=A0A0L6VT79_9BASI|nr:hypothetical protein VP01_1086g3 [Puccinia sorghi]
MSSKPVLSHTIGPNRTVKLSASPAITNIFNRFPGATTIASPPYPTSRVFPHDVQFNIIVRGQVFKLSYEQIMYDQPNLFTAAFLDGFSEADTRTLTIPGRSPVLFGFIYEYLSGYAILPNPDIDLRNLISDCEYYGLQRLKDNLTLPKLGDALSSKHSLSRVVSFEDVVTRQAHAVDWTEHGLVDTTEQPVKHVLVFLTKLCFKQSDRSQTRDMHPRAEPDSEQASSLLFSLFFFFFFFLEIHRRKFSAVKPKGTQHTMEKDSQLPSESGFLSTPLIHNWIGATPMICIPELNLTQSKLLLFSSLFFFFFENSLPCQHRQTSGSTFHQSSNMNYLSSRNSLKSRPLSFRDENLSDWTAVMAEALSATPLTLNDGEFEGNFGDLVQWSFPRYGPLLIHYYNLPILIVAPPPVFFSFTSFSKLDWSQQQSSLTFHLILVLFSPSITFRRQDQETTDKLSKIMPGLSENLRVKSIQGPPHLKLVNCCCRQITFTQSTSFWASEMSIIIAPPDNSSVSTTDENTSENLNVAKVLNCSLSTGLYRRKCTKPIVNI